MKILMVLTYYYPHWTGLTAYAQRLAEGLVARDHQVTVLTAQYRPDLALRERHNGVDIVRLPTMGRVSRGVLMPGFPRAAARLIRENDVVQVHAVLFEAPLVAWLARRAGKGTVFTNHGDLVMPNGAFDQFVERTVTALMTQALRWTDVVTTHSRDYGEHSAFMQPFLSKAAYIYPPVEIPEPIPEQMAALRREQGLEGARVVGFAGRFVEEKGFDYLLQAIPLVEARLPGTKFVYAGERNVAYEDFAGRWAHLIDQNAEHLRFLGLVTDRQRLADFLGMCDAFALPSRTDCFPSVQIEAMLCGTPTVTADIPGAREAVRVTGAGTLVRPRDPQALADGLVEVLNAPEPYRRTREQIRQVFSTERTVIEYEQLLQSLVRK
ncbi:MAG TPA: glycosyltransferase family 4 protein [Anaerolineae bacterium]|nr:glycosyltransferase family 4 protein [Anaerolineae bacterium]HOQ99461.1 glycosyltransferase family 4 protein [Anaerolineae bacterium]HPL28694.1 glycosyltransferase family 4 protein [Anaerolineae bacterium]